jgi:hypothetical protein
MFTQYFKLTKVFVKWAWRSNDNKICNELQVLQKECAQTHQQAIMISK